MNRQRTVIEPDNSGANYWKDLWTYRGLFRFLAWRDLLVKYKQTVIGVVWAVIRPLLTIAVFSKFAQIIGYPTFGIKPILLVTAATLPWQLFSSALNESSNSLIANTNLITKIYFPRLIVPMSTIIVCLVDFLIAVGILIILMCYYGQVPSSHVFFLPLFLLLALLSSMGLGIFLSALNVKYRDFRYIVPFVIQLGLFISPVAFSSSIVFNNETNPHSELVQILYSMNPMVAVIDGFRWCLFGNNFPINWRSVEISVGTTLFILIAGTMYFRKVEKNFADII